MLCLDGLGKSSDVIVLEVDTRFGQTLPQLVLNGAFRGTVLICGNTLDDCLDSFQLLINAHAPNLGTGAAPRIFSTRRRSLPRVAIRVQAGRGRSPLPQFAAPMKRSRLDMTALRISPRVRRAVLSCCRT